ncbi:MAG: dihydrofolate reductase family protein [Bacteroidia bacterium]|nr:dihydrofolate reductase family protein [Bacteroidia bacterium]
MRRIVAAINMTIDGYCDHTAGIPDEELHHHYTELLNGGDGILYGRITFQLMKYWQPLVKNPSGKNDMDEFARAIDTIPKLVFSRTLKHVEWESAALATRTLEEEVAALRRQAGRDILVGSRSLILQLMKRNLIDEYQLCVHPIIVGSGMPLFESIRDTTIFTLVKTKTFHSGAITLYYAPIQENTPKRE